MVVEWGEEGSGEKLKYSALYVVVRSRRRKQLFGGFVRHARVLHRNIPNNHYKPKISHFNGNLHVVS